ncbi:TetR/AcrR family transcriptional regulator, partial [Pseudomonas aeruginosa]|nr:TetR/AcrR family transcriptional regulator [Pseudomonas aeruginosa]
MAKRGRPCGFDREQALRRALDVFWEAGYEGATMAALKEAMGGICAPSMYAAYGSKEALFRSAVELYLSQECQLSKGAFALPTARESIAALLESAAVSYTTEGKPRG